MPCSWIAGTTAVFGSGTSFNATTPAGILDNDGLFAFVMARSAVTPPAGWTPIASGSGFGSGTTQLLYAFKKDVVTAADSSTVFTWTQVGGSRIGATYGVIRGDGGKITVSQFSVVQFSYNYSGFVDLEALTATADAGEVFLMGASTIVVFGAFTPTPPTGATLWTGTGLSDYRMSAAYQAQAKTQSNEQRYTVTNDFNENGPVGIVLRVREAAIPAGWADSALLIDTTGQFETVVDAFTMSPVPEASRRQLFDVTDTGGALISGGTATVVRSVSVSALDAVEVALALATEVLASAALVEGLALSSALGVMATLRPALLERIALRERLTRASTAFVVDDATVAAVVTTARHVALLERLGVASALVLATTQARSVVEQLAVQDVLQRMLGGTLVEAATVLDVLARRQAASAALTESVAVEPALAPHLWIRAEGSDTVALAETWTPAQRLQAILADAVTLQGTLLSPAQLLTWAINARTGAATNYTNFHYTSFARRGNHYLATSEDGLYRLDGNTDNGAAIIAELETGFLQFAGSRFSAFKALYLGVHGSGEMFVRLTTGDEKTYTYRVISQNMETTKVQVGKGLRARYFAFALETIGQDFDLDSVEFLPLGAQRRV